MAYYADGCPSNDPRSTFYERRKECYRCVLGTLKSLDDLLDETYRGQPDAAKDRTGEQRGKVKSLSLVSDVWLRRDYSARRG